MDSLASPATYHSLIDQTVAMFTLPRLRPHRPRLPFLLKQLANKEVIILIVRTLFEFLPLQL